MNVLIKAKHFAIMTFYALDPWAHPIGEERPAMAQTAQLKVAAVQMGFCGSGRPAIFWVSAAR